MGRILCVCVRTWSAYRRSVWGSPVNTVRTNHTAIKLTCLAAPLSRLTFDRRSSAGSGPRYSFSGLERKGARRLQSVRTLCQRAELSDAEQPVRLPRSPKEFLARITL
ncbi:hypothetical protein SKAU_G00141000 [Synaphobranchus kaupii]|uniref:Uncharacterized protein n=1 Tax=Synaphobranchus kaupii TaxID=118154 RepID=A0A9Q1J3A8_SYNKA|nr:hypothetical protein SKAU_G00141000 [Synaphobranchus kaupii]